MDDRILNHMVELMKEHLRWAKLSGLSYLKTIFETELRTNEDKMVYEMSDGERSIRDLEKLTKVSRSRVSLLWRRWYKIGIMEKSEKYEGKRMRKSFSLSDVGIEVDIPHTNGNEQKLEGDFE